MGPKQLTLFILTVLMTCLLIYMSNNFMNSNYRAKMAEAQERNSQMGNVKKKRFDKLQRIVKYSEDSEFLQGTCNSSLIQPRSVSNTWQKVENTSLHVYSAYLDGRLNNLGYFVRILAMSKGKYDQALFCRVWYMDNSFSIVKADHRELWIDSWDSADSNKYYRPILVSCLIKSHAIPKTISLAVTPCEKITHGLSVNAYTNRTKKDFAVCLKPMNFAEDISQRLLEWLEFQYLMGADRIAVYVYHIHPKTMDVLKIYERSGALTIHFYSTPGASSNKRNTWQKRRHEMAMYNDCFYRHVHSHKYVINLDLDEAIVPLQDYSWAELLTRVEQINPRAFKFASLASANVYFFDDFEADSSIPESFHMLRHTLRSANFTKPGFAQKSFFQTNGTLSVTHHYTLETLDRRIPANTQMGRDLVQLNHYRGACPPKMDIECEEDFMKFKVRDEAMLKFKDSLMKRVELKMKEMNWNRQ